MQAIDRLLDRVGLHQFDELVLASDPIAMTRFFREVLLGG